MKTRFAFVAAVLFLASNAFAAAAVGTIAVPEIRGRNLGSYAGKAMSVFYVSGHESGIGAAGQTLEVRSIKSGPVQLGIPASGQVDIAAVAVPMVGFDVVNFVVFAVHGLDPQAVYLRNVDGTFPTDPRVPNGDFGQIPAADFQVDRFFSMSLLKLNQLKAQQGAAFVSVDFGTDF